MVSRRVAALGHREAEGARIAPRKYMLTTRAVVKPPKP